MQNTNSTHSKVIGYLLWIFGFTGAHRFYFGKPITGAIWFFTLGLLGIGWLIDLFLIPSMDRQADRRFVAGSTDYSALVKEELEGYQKFREWPGPPKIEPPYTKLPFHIQELRLWAMAQPESNVTDFNPFDGELVVNAIRAVLAAVKNGVALRLGC